MYTQCFVCRRSFGANTSIPHLTVGRKIAFDAGRGRLWVVCRHCGQWCLTPMEDRWEAIAECDGLFSSAEARVSTVNVGLARADDVELIRVGAAFRDEIANWRYGPRLVRRRRIATIASSVVAITCGATAAVVVYWIGALAIATSSAFVGGWALMLGGVYAYKLRRLSSFAPVALLRFPDGSRRLLRRSELPLIRLGRAHKAAHVRLKISFADMEVTYSGDDALMLLRRVLPHANWRGASPVEIESAVKKVDHAERTSGHAFDKPWEQLAARDPDPVGTTLISMPVIQRLALEMAVTEELEHRAMAGEVTALGERWSDEEEIAHIADDMFLPGWIADRIRAAKRQLGSRQGER